MLTNNMADMTVGQIQRKVQYAIKEREQREAKRLAAEVVKLLNRRSLPRLNELVESWIEAGYQLGQWTQRDAFEEQVRYRTLSLGQGSGPVRVNARWGHIIP